MPAPKPQIFGDIVDWKPWGQGGDEFSDYAIKGEWAPVWKGSATGAEMTNASTDQKISEQQALLSNPNSKFYTEYYKKLKGTLSAGTSLNSLIGLNRAMGLGMTGSATIANEQRKAVEGKITDYAGRSTEDLFQANIGASNSLLGMQLNNSQFQQGYQFQKKQYEDSQKFDWSSLAKMAGNIAGFALAPATGGASMAANTTIQGGTSLLGKTPDPTEGKRWTMNGWR